MNQLFEIDITNCSGVHTVYAFGTEKTVNIYANRQATAYGGTAKTFPIVQHTCRVPFKDVTMLT